MRKLLHYIHERMSCCLNCGSLWISGQGLCEPCLGTLKRKSVVTEFYAHDLKVSTLFPWVPGESDLLSFWLLSMKGKSPRTYWRYWAYQLARHKLKDLPRHCVIIPAPATRKGEQDHAYRWGEALAEVLGGEFAPCLEKPSGQSQRRASVADRQGIELKVLENYSGVHKASSATLWVFADDILTTGATARAAREALGNPVHFEVWTLAQRKLSCGASKSLL